MTNRKYGTNSQSDLDSLFNSFESEVNNSLPQDAQDRYLNGISNATVFSSHGLGVDYANSFNYFIVGGGIGFGADAGSNSVQNIVRGSVDQSTLSGFAAQASIMGGFRMKRLAFYGNYLSRNLGANVSNFNSKFSSYGAHIQLKVLKEKKIIPLGMLEWGGLDLTAGFRKTVLTAVFTKKISKTVTQTVDGSTATATIQDATFRFGAESSIRSFPVELSTSFRYFNILSTYFGYGFVANSGSTTSIASLNGNFGLSGSSISSGASATASLDLGDSGNPSSSDHYYFIGEQINILMLKTYFHVADSPRTNALSIGLGVRIAF